MERFAQKNKLAFRGGPSKDIFVVSISPSYEMFRPLRSRAWLPALCVVTIVAVWCVQVTMLVSATDTANQAVPKRTFCSEATANQHPSPRIDERRIGRYNAHVRWARIQGYGHNFTELLRLSSSWHRSNTTVTVVLNHFSRDTICQQLRAVFSMTVRVTEVWVCLFNSPNRSAIEDAVRGFSEPRIRIISAEFDFRYYGRFQLALQATTQFVLVLDDDMIPGRKYLEVLLHAMHTKEYHGLLGSIGWLLPNPEMNGSLISYRHPEAKSLYFPDLVYNLQSLNMVETDLLCSAWFLKPEWAFDLFHASVPTWQTGEDFMISSRLRVLRGIRSFVLPVDPIDMETWGDKDHRLAANLASTVGKPIFAVRDAIWKGNLLKGDLPLWSSRWFLEKNFRGKLLLILGEIEETQSDQVEALLQVFQKKRWWCGVVILQDCQIWCQQLQSVFLQKNCSRSCQQAEQFGFFHLNPSDLSYVAYFSSLVAKVSPQVVLTISLKARYLGNIDEIGKAYNYVPIHLRDAAQSLSWLPVFSGNAVREWWKKPQFSIHVITVNRVKSLDRLYRSLLAGVYLGDRVDVHFHLDSEADVATVRYVSEAFWPHGLKYVHHRVVRGGLISAVVESYYPSSDQEFGILLEDDLEVSPQFYNWLRYAIMWSHVNEVPHVIGVSLYTPRLIEVVLPRKKWNSWVAFGNRSTPYLQQLPCSWGAVYFPSPWKAFHSYLTNQIRNATTVKIPHSATNGWAGSWKKYLIEWMLLHEDFMLYPSYSNQTSFSTNHLEPGEHIASSANKLAHLPQDFTVPLHENNLNWFYALPLSEISPLQSIPRVNLFGSPVSSEEVRELARDLRLQVLGTPLEDLVQ